jgi:gephyrin
LSYVQDGDLEGCVQRALYGGADVIVSSGGVSMGDRDLIKPLLERSGTVHCGRVLMKPGKPLTVATLALGEARRVLFFGLPGAHVT